jgi:hypothetical protein
MSFREVELTADKVVLPVGIEVPWGEWRQSSAFNTLYTTGIEECIAVAVYDPLRCIGHMAHILARKHLQDELLPDFVESIANSCDGETNRLSICIAGGRADEDSIQLFHSAMIRRKAVLDTFTELGIPKPWHIAWDEEYIKSNLDLDCSSGINTLTRVYPARRWPAQTTPETTG